MNLAITGHTGFIGSALVKTLRERHDVSLSLFNSHTSSFSDIDSLKDFVKDQDILIHLAGVTSPDTCYEVNTLGTKNLLEAFVHFGKKSATVIFSSSFAVYEAVSNQEGLSETLAKTLPRNQYGLSKLFAEELLAFYSREYNIQSRILRIANPYGPMKPGKYNGIISILIDKIYKEEAITIQGDGSQVRDFIFIDDVIQAISKTIDYKKHELLVNICTGEGISIIECITKIELLLGKKARILFATESKEKGFWIGNPDKAEQEIHFKASVSLDKGLPKTVHWYLKQQTL